MVDAVRALLGGRALMGVAELGGSVWQVSVHAEGPIRVARLDPHDNVPIGRADDAWREAFGAAGTAPETIHAIPGGWLATDVVVDAQQADAAGVVLLALFEAATLKERATRDAGLVSLQRFILDEVPAAVVVTDPVFRVLSWNRNAERLFGWTADEALGRPGRELMTDPSQAAIVERFRDAMTRRTHASGEYLATRKDGTTVPVTFVLRALRDERDTTTHIVMVLLDMTERRAAELRNQRLARIVAITTDLVATFGPDLHLTSLNSAGRQMLGIADDESVTGRPIWDFLPEETAEVIRREAAPALRADSVWAGESVLRWAGREVPVSQVVLAHHGEDGAIEYLSTVARDISGQRAVEQRLRRREAQQAAVATLSREALVVKDIQELTESAVALIADVLDVPIAGAGQVLGDPPVLTMRAIVGVEQEIPPFALPAGSGAEHVLRTGLPLIVEDYATLDRAAPSIMTQFGVRSGVTVLIGQIDRPWGLLSANALAPGVFSEEAVDFMQAVANVLAATVQRHQTEEVLRRAQRLEALGRFAGGVAHDFNNLLTAILGYLDVITMQVAGNAAALHATQQAGLASRSAAALVDQLLTFSRGQSMTTEIIDVTAGLGAVHDMLSHVVGGSVTVRLDLADEPAPTRIGEHQLHQVMLNLALNAADAMPDGGELVIKTTLLDAATAVARGLTEQSHVGVAVTDTGTGMDAETQARLFEPYFTTKGPGKGTGLGLPAVYGIVTEAGGRVDVASELGRGTTVTVWLPCADPLGALTAASVAQQSTATRRTAAAPDTTILLVEDQVAVRSLVHAVLIDRGYTVLVASNGIEALAVAGAYDDSIHLVITDVVMPQMQGPALVAQLRAVGRDPLVLYMSGYHEEAALNPPGEERRAFLRKPFGLSELIDAVEGLLGTD